MHSAAQTVHSGVWKRDREFPRELITDRQREETLEQNAAHPGEARRSLDEDKSSLKHLKQGFIPTDSNHS